MRVRTWAASDIGKVRTTQDDAFLVDSPLLAQADGMGGKEMGGTSARKLIALLAARRPRNIPTLIDLVRLADGDLFRTWGTHAGTTLDVVLLGEEVLGVHAGDSRVYWGKKRGRKDSVQYYLTPVTRDHGTGHYLDNFVGSGRTSFDLVSIPWLPGDFVVLCSDGLTGEMPDWKIADVLWSQTRNPAKALVRHVVNETRARDNVTVVVAKRLD
jgi:protein phosphatase